MQNVNIWAKEVQAEPEVSAGEVCMENPVRTYFDEGGIFRVECNTKTTDQYMNCQVVFLNDTKCQDETEFSLRAYDKEELASLFMAFCKEARVVKPQILGIYVVETSDRLELLL